MLWVPQQNLWVMHCCDAMVVWQGRWKDSKRFYNPEFDAAHDPALQVIRRSLKVF